MNTEIPHQVMKVLLYLCLYSGLFLNLCCFLFHRLCTLTLKKLVVLKELDKELNSLSIAVKIQVGGLISLV